MFSILTVDKREFLEIDSRLKCILLGYEYGLDDDILLADFREAANLEVESDFIDDTEDEYDDESIEEFVENKFLEMVDDPDFDLLSKFIHDDTWWKIKETVDKIYYLVYLDSNYYDDADSIDWDIDTYEVARAFSRDGIWDFRDIEPEEEKEILFKHFTNTLH